MTAVRMWSPNSHKSRRASSLDVDIDAPELGVTAFSETSERVQLAWRSA
jgi:hypothetical protein